MRKPRSSEIETVNSIESSGSSNGAYPREFVILGEESSSGSGRPERQAEVMPRTGSEWELYALLFHANLLQYYPCFIAQGGDDVRQLMEAGDEEFLEIMALIGMAAKPLHVRRLQKTLHELMENPSKLHILSAQFQAAASGSAGVLAVPPPPPLLPYQPILPAHPSRALQTWTTGSETGSPSLRPSSSSSGLADWESDTGSCNDTPALTEQQLEKIKEVARDIAPTLPEVEPKLVQNKKKISPEVLKLLDSKEDASERIEEFRKYAAIYGRFDKNRRPHKPLSLHEVTINEAATQLSLLKPPLLTRRDELFALARQLVKDAQIRPSGGEEESEEGSLRIVEENSSPHSSSQGLSPGPASLSDAAFSEDSSPLQSQVLNRRKRKHLGQT